MELYSVLVAMLKPEKNNPFITVKYGFITPMRIQNGFTSTCIYPFGKTKYSLEILDPSKIEKFLNNMNIRQNKYKFLRKSSSMPTTDSLAGANARSVPSSSTSTTDSISEASTGSHLQSAGRADSLPEAISESCPLSSARADGLPE
ncbi:hypothetical protein PR048_008891, partial [Dryococelus australis]